MYRNEEIFKDRPSQNFQFLSIFFQNFIEFATNKFQIFITVQDFAPRKRLVTVETGSLLLVIKHSLNLKAPQAPPRTCFQQLKGPSAILIQTLAPFK
jgi:hypothetical protein